MDVDGGGEGTPVVPRVQASHNSYCVASDLTPLLYSSILVTRLNLDGFLVNFLVNFQGG